MFRLPGRRARARKLPLTVALALAVAWPMAAAADTHTVTDCGDSIPGGTSGQLRHLINTAAAGDTIVIPACTVSLAGAGFDDANAGETSTSRSTSPSRAPARARSWRATSRIGPSTSTPAWC
jgi:hypothetical protein